MPERIVGRGWRRAFSSALSPNKLSFGSRVAKRIILLGNSSTKGHKPTTNPCIAALSPCRHALAKGALTIFPLAAAFISSIQPGSGWSNVSCKEIIPGLPSSRFGIRYIYPNQYNNKANGRCLAPARCHTLRCIGGAMNTKELVGRRLRELRKKRRLTQERLAEKASVDLKYLGSIERGSENPTIGTLEKLATALSVKVSQMLEFEHQLKGEISLRRRIGQMLDKCDEQELQIILKIINAIKN